MSDRARERAGITESVWFKDLRAAGATDAAKAGTHIREIQTLLAHTSSKTSEIYSSHQCSPAHDSDNALFQTTLNSPKLQSLRNGARWSTHKTE